MERESGSRTTYQFTLEQIEAMKRQAVLDAKEKMKQEIAKEIDEHIQEEWKQREQEMSGERARTDREDSGASDVSSCTDLCEKSTGKVSGMRMIIGQSSFSSLRQL